MKYVALLRGINVGGKNKVDMKLLKASFEKRGFEDVSTYINTGNIFFTDTKRTRGQLVQTIESLMSEDFGLEIRALVRSQDEIQSVADALPVNWTNEPDTMKSDVMFLWDEVDSPDVVDKIQIKDGIDSVIYVPGTLLWSVSRQNQTKSGMQKLVGTKLYKQMTIRNVNTFRKITELISSD